MMDRRALLHALLWSTTPLAAGARAEPVVGSLFPFIRSQATEAPSLSFLEPRFTDWRTWWEEARTKLLSLLHHAPPSVAPNAKIKTRADRGDHVLELLEFTVAPGLRVPAFVLIPKNLTAPAPAVVALHDHGGFYVWGKEKLVATDNEHAALREFKRTNYSGKSIATELVRQGYVVIVIDMFYWGQRRMTMASDPTAWRDAPETLTVQEITDLNTRSAQYFHTAGRAVAATGVTWPGLMIWDDLRTVDYLVSRPEVDPARIFCVGLSIGGFRAAHLAALDERIKAAVVVGYMASYPYQIRDLAGIALDHINLIPGLYRYLDYADIVAMAMPAALLAISGSKDPLFDSAGARLGAQRVLASYRKAGMSERVRMSVYDAAHEFNAEMQAEAWEWLRKWH